jgi:hypothetical protein
MNPGRLVTADHGVATRGLRGRKGHAWAKHHPSSAAPPRLSSWANVIRGQDFHALRHPRTLMLFACISAVIIAQVA